MRVLVRPLIVFLFLILIGVAGYMAIEGWNALDSLYMVAITLSTVGFREVGEVSPGGRLFTIGLIILGISTGGYLIARFGEFLIEGQIQGITRRRRMQKQIRALSGHAIVCGFGRVGRQICEEFEREGQSFVVVELDSAAAETLTELGYRFIIGDASLDEVLEEAGIRAAAGVVVAVDSDADSVFVTLTARSLNASVQIVSVARNPETVHKLRRAGATRVVSPFLIAGRRMASMVTRPATVGFLDTVMQRSGGELRIEELTIQERSQLNGITLGAANLRRRAGVMVLAIVQPNGEYLFNPDADVELCNGQMLIALGTHAQLEALRGVV